MPCSGCPVTAVNLEMLQRDDAVFREAWRSTTRQLDLSLSFSKGGVIVDIRTCVRTGFAEGLQSIQTREERYFSEFLALLKLRKRPYPELLQQMKPAPIIRKWRQKNRPWNGTILYVHGRKNSKYPSAGKIMFTVLWTVKDWFLWTRCLEGREYTPTPTSGRWQKSGSVSKEIGSQESNRYLASAWQRKA